MAARTPLVSLMDIENAIRRIERYTKGKSQAEFEKDEMVRDAVARCVEIISEASRRIPRNLKARRPEIPWDKVAGVGNIFRHEYDAVHPPLVWEMIVLHLPPLKRAVRALIRELKSDQP